MYYTYYKYITNVRDTVRIRLGLSIYNNYNTYCT